MRRSMTTATARPLLQGGTSVGHRHFHDQRQCHISCCDFGSVHCDLRGDAVDLFAITAAVSLIQVHPPSIYCRKRAGSSS